MEINITLLKKMGYYATIINKIFCVYEIMRRNCNGIYSVLEQIRKRLSEETTYTEGVSEVPEGEDPSFEANQVASGYSLPWDSGDRKNPGL